MNNSHNVLIALVAIVVLLTGANLYFTIADDGDGMVEFEDRMMLKEDKDDMVKEMGEMMDNMEERMMEDSEEEVVKESSFNEYSAMAISLKYPEGYHVYAQELYDDPPGKQHHIVISDSPVIEVSPSEGAYWEENFQAISFHTGDAFMAGYEGDTWKSFEEDTVTINGQAVTRLRLEGDVEKYVFAPAYEEVYFFFGQDMGYEVRKSWGSADEARADEGFNQILNSIVVK